MAILVIIYWKRYQKISVNTTFKVPVTNCRHKSYTSLWYKKQILAPIAPWHARQLSTNRESKDKLLLRKATSSLLSLFSNVFLYTAHHKAHLCDTQKFETWPSLNFTSSSFCLFFILCKEQLCSLPRLPKHCQSNHH